VATTDPAETIDLLGTLLPGSNVHPDNTAA